MKFITETWAGVGLCGLLGAVAGLAVIVIVIVCLGAALGMI